MMENKLFYERLMCAVKESGKSINSIEKELGYARNALHNYKYGVEPSGSRLIELSNYFSLTPEYLIGITSIKQAESMSDVFKELNTEQKIDIMIIAQHWYYHQFLK